MVFMDGCTSIPARMYFRLYSDTSMKAFGNACPAVCRMVVAVRFLCGGKRASMNALHNNYVLYGDLSPWA